MMGPQAEFQVADADALSGDVTELVNRFTKQLSVDDAKSLRGSLLLSIPVFDPDSRPNWAIPEYRRYIANADRALPHFPFFLVANPMMGQVKVYLAALAPIADPATGGFRRDQMIDLAERKANDVAAYCETLGEDPEDAVAAIYINLPVELIKQEPQIAARFEKAMGPMLARIRERLPVGDSLEDMEREIVAEVGQLYDIDTDDYDSDSELINDVLERMPPAITREAFRIFDTALDELLKPRGGGVLGVESGQLIALVRLHPEAARAFVEMHVRMGASQPGYLRSAATIAAAIAIALHDRWPMKQVERRAAELGLETEEWTPGIAEDVETARQP
jgi:hypothetical protein